jgi:hypothetical protein
VVTKNPGLLLVITGRGCSSFFVLFECREGNAVTGWAIPRTIDNDVGHPTFPVSAITANFYG